MKSIKVGQTKKSVVTISIAFFALCAAFSLQSCHKWSNCYDAQLEATNKNMLCTEDCPGVIGCDGKKYCNECIANSVGIRVKK
jgi:hypothetical protein